MFLGLAHSKLDVYNIASDLVLECYHLMELLPLEERYNLIQQIKRAALSVKLNIVEGASHKTIRERKRFFEISRSSVAELDAAFEMCVKLGFLQNDKLKKVAQLIVRCYQMLSKMT